MILNIEDIGKEFYIVITNSNNMPEIFKTKLSGIHINQFQLSKYEFKSTTKVLDKYIDAYNHVSENQVFNCKQDAYDYLLVLIDKLKEDTIKERDDYINNIHANTNSQIEKYNKCLNYAKRFAKSETDSVLESWYDY
jgi:hypothetical protein